MDFENPWFKGWAFRVVQRRCPNLSEKELEEAAQNLLAYMEVVWDIYQRLKSEGRIEEVMAQAQAEREHELNSDYCSLAILHHFCPSAHRK